MTTVLTTHSSFLDFRAAMNLREEFRTHGALWGIPTPLDSPSYGRLPAEYVESFHSSDYVVYSYGTPIAWHVPAYSGRREYDYEDAQPAAWVMPDERYSVTTSRHQSKIRAALHAEVY